MKFRKEEDILYRKFEKARKEEVCIKDLIYYEKWYYVLFGFLGSSYSCRIQRRMGTRTRQVGL